MRTTADRHTIPDFSEMIAAKWDSPGTLTNLGSLNDWVYRLDVGDQPHAVVKFSIADRVDDCAIAAEAEAIARLSSAWPTLELPTLRAGLDGRLPQRQGAVVGRMMNWVNGFALQRAPHWTNSALTSLGGVAGHVSHALGGFDHPGLRRFVEWDPRNAVEVVDGYLPHTSGRVHQLLTAALKFLDDAMPAAADQALLPEQPVHLDLTDLNVLGTFDADGSFTPTGIIDFGDLVWTWRLCELAVAVHAAVGRRPRDPLAALTAVLTGFLEYESLSETEADYLWSLVVARAAICVAAESVEAATATDNVYVTDLAAMDLEVLDGALSVDPWLARAVVRMTCGLTAHPVDVAARLHEAGPTPVVTAAAITRDWHWLELVDDATDAVDAEAPDAMSLGEGFTVAGGVDVVAPLDGRMVEVSDIALTLSCDVDGTAVFVRIDGVAAAVGAGDEVTRGQVLGTLEGDPRRLDLQLFLNAAAPRYGKVRDRAVWSTLCPDPSVLVGLEAAVTRPHTAERRGRHVASAQRTYYREPLEIVRARGQWMYDHTGRRYLDMVNNVAIVGHSHPKITEAAVHQLSRLNTNSRFLYRAIADYADKITDTLPDALQSVFFVNSGSEGLELALQLARTFTSRRDMLVLEGFYHGWTNEVFELCTMPGDRPQWRAELAPWVHVADCPDGFRGPHLADVDSALQSLSGAIAGAEARGGVAGFVHEPLFGSLGGVAPPAGYFPRAYEAVRSSGGLAIADEVQVGYGRTGESFWAFADQGVVPDIVVAAKAAGNGHPVGFVACRPEIAEEFAERSGFFSTSAGNPVSCAIGSAVLDVLREEQLPHNAAEVGALLSTQLAELGRRHREIGAVYGKGLYQGVDLVTGDGTSTPLPAADVSSVCERLRELGVVVQATGLYGNVLKVKPPLCIHRADAAEFIAALDRVLTERAAFRALSISTPTPSTLGDDQ